MVNTHASGQRSWMRELRRRNVLRVGIAWLALGWAVVAMADLLLPRLGLPQAWLRGLILSLLALLPLVLVASWRYELTSHGLRVDRGPGQRNPENARTGRRLDQLTIMLVLLALVLSGLRQLVLPALQPSPAGAPAAVQTPALAPVSSVPALPPLPPAPPGPVDPRSLAVLPFANLSTEPGSAFLADGIAEEILHVLARVPGLRVASRTSSFSFRDSPPGAREIGRQLGVAYILEGSLRRHEEQLRISVQLVHAAEDRQVWSGTFDRQLTDIFNVQEQIAQSVTDTLAGAFGVEAVAVRRATDDLGAYELYLRGKQLFALRGTNLEAARKLLQQAVDRDPRFAEAWATLAGICHVMPSYLPGGDAELSALATKATQRALALLPEQPDALAVSARLAANAGDRVQAMDLLQRALAADPNNANSWMWKGLTLLEVGRIRDAREAFAEGQRLDPLSGIHYGWLGAIEIIDGNPATAREHLQRAHSMGWRGPASGWLLKLALAEGDPQQVALLVAQWIRDDSSISEPARAVHHSVAPAVADPAHREQARATMADAVRQIPEHDWTALYLFLGLTDEAIEEALRSKPASGQIMMMLIWSPVDRAFREHPRFAEVAERTGLLAFWRQHGGPDTCRPPEPSAARLECSQ
jgi:adenylate cyclase